MRVMLKQVMRTSLKSLPDIDSVMCLYKRFITVMKELKMFGHRLLPIVCSGGVVVFTDPVCWAAV